MSADTCPRTLPGDRTAEDAVERMIRVDHAGEYGAMRIYAGQLAVLKDPESRTLIQHMMEQESRHLAAFETLVRERRVRPTALMPVWHAAGFLMGAATALLGKEAAMACTAAVESVIDEHYAQQCRQLGESEKSLAETLETFRREEMEHHDTAMAHGAPEAPVAPLLSGAIRQATRLAIWLSTRI